MILLKSNEVIDFLTPPPTDFSAFKNVQATAYNTNSMSSFKQHS